MFFTGSTDVANGIYTFDINVNVPDEDFVFLNSSESYILFNGSGTGTIDYAIDMLVNISGTTKSLRISEQTANNLNHGTFSGFWELTSFVYMFENDITFRFYNLTMDNTEIYVSLIVDNDFIPVSKYRKYGNFREYPAFRFFQDTPTTYQHFLNVPEGYEAYGCIIVNMESKTDTTYDKAYITDENNIVVRTFNPTLNGNAASLTFNFPSGDYYFNYTLPSGNIFYAYGFLIPSTLTPYIVKKK